MPHIFFQNLEKRRNTQTLFSFSSLNNLENLERQMGLNVHYQLFDPYMNPSPFMPYGAPYSDSLWQTKEYMISYYGLRPPLESPWGYSQLSPWNSRSSQWNSPCLSSWDFPSAYLQSLDWKTNWLSDLLSQLSSFGSSSILPYSEPNIPVPDPDPGWPDPDWWQDYPYTPGTWYGLIKRSNLFKG